MESEKVESELTSKEAAELLAGLAADQSAVRQAVVPPAWYIPSLAACLFVDIASGAMPESWAIARLILVWVVLAVIITLFLVYLRQARARVTKRKWFSPLRYGLFPAIGIWSAIMVSMVILDVTSPPWWVYIVVAAVLSAALVVFGRWIWRRWVAARPVEV